MSYIKSVLSDKNKRRVFSNVFSLTLLQATNYIVPLIALPYLIRVLGDEKFGLVMFSQVFIQYFMVLVDFGMEFIGTREVSIHRKDAKKLNELFNTLMVIKAILFLFSVLILSIVVFSFERFRIEALLYFLTFGMVCGQMLFPVWLFQGLEKMNFVVFFNFISKSIFTVLIFVFIKSPEDYTNYAVINSLGYIISGIISVLVAVKMINYKFFIPDMTIIKEYFYKTGNVFFSNFGISMYITSTPFILGLVTQRNDLVGYYSAAEKTVRGIRYAVTPITQALFPYLSKRFHGESMANSLVVLKKIALLVSPFILVLMSVLLFFTEFIVELLTGSVNTNIMTDIKIMSVILIVGTLNNIFGVLGMVNLKLERVFRNYVVIIGIINIFLCLILSKYFLDIGASIGIVVTESLLLLLLIRKLFFGVQNG